MIRMRIVQRWPAITPGWWRRVAPLLRISMLTVVLTACGGGSGGDEPAPLPPYSYQQPISTGDGWSVASLEEVGIARAPVEAAVNKIRQQTLSYRFIDGLLIARNGKLVLAERFRTQLNFADDWGGNRDLDLHILNSVTKSYASTMVGIAIDQGFLPSTDVKVHDYFWDKQPVQHWSQAKADTTLADWLTMRHGYQWDEWSRSYFDAQNINARMNNAADPIQFLLDQPLASTPGSTFAYSTGVSYGLGVLVQRASNLSVAQFLETYLFTPLNTQRYDAWYLDNQIHMGSALYLSIRDMAKLGQLYLDGGVWNGLQVVSAQWVQQATARHVDRATADYGYQWWLTQFNAAGQRYDSYYADGLGGQYIFVLPQFNAVIAFHGSAYTQAELDQRNIRHIIEQDLIPAMSP